MFRKEKTFINDLQKNTKNIRNLCILAHVDHGKNSPKPFIIYYYGTSFINLPKILTKSWKILSELPKYYHKINLDTHTNLFYKKKGKTTLADTLLATNAIISNRMSGKVYYI